MIELDTSICSYFGTSSSREWLETNGIGGYASSSISGANTRRYHGLLVAATRPPLGRMVLLSKFEDVPLYRIASDQHKSDSIIYVAIIFNGVPCENNRCCNVVESCRYQEPRYPRR